MIWFFARAGQRLRYEIRRKDEGDGYQLEITYPDGRTAVEDMQAASDLLKRCAELAESLEREGWRAAG